MAHTVPTRVVVSQSTRTLSTSPSIWWDMQIVCMRSCTISIDHRPNQVCQVTTRSEWCVNRKASPLCLCVCVCLTKWLSIGCKDGRLLPRVVDGAGNPSALSLSLSLSRSLRMLASGEPMKTSFLQMSNNLHICKSTVTIWKVSQIVEHSS